MRVFIACAVAESAVYIPYIGVFVLAAYYLLCVTSHGDGAYRRKMRNASIFILLLLAFVLSTFLWTSQIVVALRTRSALGDSLSRIGTVIFYLSYLTADVIVAVNVLRLAQWALWVRILLLVVWAASAITGAVSLVRCLGWLFACLPVALTGWFISVAFNGITTLLLARVAWLLCQATALPAKQRDKIIACSLVACSSAYVLFCLARVRVVLGTDDGVPHGIRIVNCILYQLTGLYPTLLTLLVAIALKDPSAQRPAARSIATSPADVLVGGVHSYPLPGAADTERVAALEMAQAKTVAALADPKHESAILGNSGPGEAGGHAGQDGEWHAVRRAALDVGITPQTLLASINLVRSREVPPRYQG